MSSDTFNESVVRELVAEITRIDHEIQTLNEEKRSTIEDYKERLDVKTFAAALRIARIRQKAKASDAELDGMVDAILGGS